jgi:hypothetical protein
MSRFLIQGAEPDQKLCAVQSLVLGRAVDDRSSEIKDSSSVVGDQLRLQNALVFIFHFVSTPSDVSVFNRNTETACLPRILHRFNRSSSEYEERRYRSICSSGTTTDVC